MFSGHWETPDTLATTFYAGKLSLAVGHFGSEMTGVVHFLDADGLPQPDTECQCAFLTQEAIDLGERTFVIVAQPCKGTRWIWRLALDTTGDVDVLAGTLEEQGGVDPVAVRFELIDTFVSNEDKACEEE